MITNFLLQIVYAFLSFLLGLLPTGGAFPTSWTTGIYTIWGYVNSFSFIVPVDIFVTALAIAMSFHLFVLAWKFLHWVWGLIRGARYH